MLRWSVFAFRASRVYWGTTGKNGTLPNIDVTSPKVRIQDGGSFKAAEYRGRAGNSIGT